MIGYGMKLIVEDFNGAKELCEGKFKTQWQEIDATLSGMPLHIKSSDQDGIQGSLIFDPVGTNEYIKATLTGHPHYWRHNIALPTQFDFLGTDVDFVKTGVLAEAQFSNYPFLLNNTIRSELFFKAKLPLGGAPIEMLVMISKGKMFPASNSTLYYEQAQKQLTGLAKYSVVDIPIRLVGLIVEPGEQPAMFTEYHAARYSRTVVNREERLCRISVGTRATSRCSVVFL